MKTSKQNMLHAHTMQLTLFPFAVFLMLTISAFAQNGIVIDSSINAIRTITRSRNTGYNLMYYVKTSDTTGKFLFNFQPSQLPPFLPQYTEIPISGYDVTDFIVTHDTVYMCGNEAHGRGFYGWMKLGPSPSSVQLKIYNLYDDTSYIVNPRRIYVFHILNRPMVALIGDYFGPSTLTNTPAVIRIGVNDINYNVAFRLGEHFDDVVVLDNYIVTVARKGYNNPTGASQYMRVVQKSGFNLNNTLFKRCYEISPHSANSRILLQHLGGDNLVSVYQDGAEFYVNSLSVNSSGILQFNQYYIVDTVVDNIYDVAYNATDSSLMIIHSKQYNSTASRFRCNPTGISWIESYRPHISGYRATIMSMARTITTRFMVSGILDNFFMVWNTNGNCNDPQYISVTSDSLVMPYRVTETTRRKIGFNSLTLTRPKQTTYANQICY